MSTALIQQAPTFEVVLSNGDRAEADSPEAIILAARTLLDEARDGRYYGRLTATFLHEGKCVRANVPESSV